MPERFNDVENKSLRAFNRATMAYNIKEDAGSVKAAKYLEGFSKQEKAEILGIMSYICANGLEQTKRDIMKDVEVVSV